MPSEQAGFHGWRSEDDAYWREFRRQEKEFRGPNIPQFDPENDESEAPKNRHGEDIAYPAQARWDLERQEVVPTTEEEENELRGDNPVFDPFFVEEATEEEYRHSLERGDQASDVPLQLKEILYNIGKVSVEDDEIDTEAEPNAKVNPFWGKNARTAPKVADVKLERLGLNPGDWRVVHLGTSSAIPTLYRNVSSTAFISVPPSGGEPDMVLVDAGENTEARLLDATWCMSHGFRWIRAVVVTHLHGDHIYGLPGLLRGIGEYCQFRRRAAMNGGEPEPVIRIFGPYGLRGFLRTSLFWTNPVGVKFSVAELVPREGDFSHIVEEEESGRKPSVMREIAADGTVRELRGDDPKWERKVPPPHPDEVETKDVRADEDGVWRIFGDAKDEMRGFEVVSAPLRHRVPCFGYVFRGPKRPRGRTAEAKSGESEVEGKAAGHDAVAPPDGEIDLEKARALGVYGSQFRVLRSGRSVVVKKTGVTVRPEDVGLGIDADAAKVVAQVSDPVASDPEESDADSAELGTRKVVLLGDTCDSSAIAAAAQGADVLMHEATFANALHKKAAQAFHSTAGMAGRFAREIGAKKLVLTHFSSRYEGMTTGEAEEGDGETEHEDLYSSSQLVREAASQCGGCKVVAALDYMEHTVRGDGEVRTRDKAFNRFATMKVYGMFRDGGKGEAEDGVAEVVWEESAVDDGQFATLGE